MRFDSMSVNVLFPVNLAAAYFGGKWVLFLLGFALGWGEYSLIFLVTMLVWLASNLKYTITWSR